MAHPDAPVGDSEGRLGRRVFLAMIPINLLMIPWIWFGRALFGSMGWFMLIMLYALPFVVLAMVITTVLAFVRLDKPRSFTVGQARAHLVVWGALLGFGFFLVDFGDTEDSVSSAFSQVFGNSETVLGLSSVVSVLCALTAVAAWLVLLSLLLAHKRHSGPSDLVPSPGGSTHSSGEPG